MISYGLTLNMFDDFPKWIVDMKLNITFEACCMINYQWVWCTDTQA